MGADLEPFSTAPPQAWIIQQYSVYVLHLERALSEVETIFADASAKGSSASKTDRTVLKTFLVRLGYLSPL